MPPYPFSSRTPGRLILAAAGIAVLAGCARNPAGGPGTAAPRLVFSAQVEGSIRTGFESGGTGLPYVYIIALRLSKEDSPVGDGPDPVVVPGGNGFVAGECTHYILWDPLRTPEFTLWRFTDETLNSFEQIGIPISYDNVRTGDDTLRVEVDLTQLVPPSEAEDYVTAQVNFLTMNGTAVSGGGRIWDALGDARVSTEINRPFQFSLRSARTFTNLSLGSIEPSGDSADPDLDLTDWSVEVRRD
ncbi:MAG: hypothetical protein MH204_06790 [Fimbriimonadaceae bacterium]|nr:hypothetical protein [Fimbriimonadaceae bacterium]